ncbi:hypothetical protein CAPTEDRAFT_188943 [Capitella teleta]|uniref:G-protein coupled receptors family 1 profile domain-containing protein n=1 Tax=Capitella teleta TaxID=283909 RepID=R7UBN6_CAPTE|nr:hypothetical protein CAPTEDRAFT_188943 [Capitella teleta]|eukprot:ELU03394.1 hypothetical protein CAPTEDRAFT_188943 [Capitella teleta]
MANSSNITAEQEVAGFNGYTSILVTISCLVMVGNLLMLTTILTNRELRRNISPIVVSLAFADFFVGFFTVLIHWTDDPVWSYLTNLAVTSSVTHLVLIAGDRFMAIFAPLKYHAINSTKPVTVVLIVTWISVAIVTAIMEFTSVFGKNNKYKMQFPTYFIIICSLLILYGYIGRVAWRQRRQIETQAGQAEEKIPKATKVLSAVLGAYIIMWAPYNFLLCSIITGNVKWTSNKFFNYAGFIGISNSGVNIFIYLLMSSQFRHAFINYVCCRRNDVSNG